MAGRHCPDPARLQPQSRKVTDSPAARWTVWPAIHDPRIFPQLVYKEERASSDMEKAGEDRQTF